MLLDQTEGHQLDRLLHQRITYIATQEVVNLGDWKSVDIYCYLLLSADQWICLLLHCYTQTNGNTFREGKRCFQYGRKRRGSL